MEGSVIQLSRYRFDRATEMLNDAKVLLEQKRYASSVNPQNECGKIGMKKQMPGRVLQFCCKF